VFALFFLQSAHQARRRELKYQNNNQNEQK